MTEKNEGKINFYFKKSQRNFLLIARVTLPLDKKSSLDQTLKSFCPGKQLNLGLKARSATNTVNWTPI